MRLWSMSVYILKGAWCFCDNKNEYSACASSHFIWGVDGSVEPLKAGKTHIGTFQLQPHHMCAAFQ